MQSDRVLGLLKHWATAPLNIQLRGESIHESIFALTGSEISNNCQNLDAAKTSLMQPAIDGGRNATGADRLSGTYLHQSTTGAPEQRFLIIYEKNSPEQLNGLLNLLRNEVDVAASQIALKLWL